MIVPDELRAMFLEEMYSKHKGALPAPLETGRGYRRWAVPVLLDPAETERERRRIGERNRKVNEALRQKGVGANRAQPGRFVYHVA